MKMFKVITPIPKKQGGTYWMRVGSAFENRDGSTNVYLDAYPVSGKLQLRDADFKAAEDKGNGIFAAGGAQ